MIPAHHRRALRQRLDEDGRVVFKNGNIIEREGETSLMVRWPGAQRGQPTERRVNDLAYDQLAQAYALAMEGPPPPYVAPRRPKRQPPERDYGPCPF